MSIELRFVIVNECGRFGEGDRVMGACQKQVLVTLNERKSRYSLSAHMSFKTEQAVSDALVPLLTPFATCVHTRTTDNGRTFAQREQMAGELGADFFSARSFFPKKIARVDHVKSHRSSHRSQSLLSETTQF